MNITRGIINKPVKTLIYGPEGIGKTTFAAQFPNVVFIDTEHSTDHMDVARFPVPQTWTELLRYVDEAIASPDELKTLAIDTIDWAERLCMQHILEDNHWDSIESPGFGKGYTVLMEQFSKLLDKLSMLPDRGVNVVLTAHTTMRTVTLPEESGNYDKWELKLQKKTAPLVKEWADLMLFANYKTMVIMDEKSGKNKARGGQRVMYTTHTTTFDAKNRFGLPDEMKFSFDGIRHLIPSTPNNKPEAPKPVEPPQRIKPTATMKVVKPQSVRMPTETHRALAQALTENGLSLEDAEYVVNVKYGFAPEGTKYAEYQVELLAQIMKEKDRFIDICKAEKAARDQNDEEVPF